MGLPLFRNGDKPSQRALEIIVCYMHRVARPVYLGHISLEIRWSLARTEEMMQHLEDHGIVRKLSDVELKQRGLPKVANVYALTETPQLSKAYVP